MGTAQQLLILGAGGGGGGGDPYFSSVQMLCHFDSSSGTPRAYTNNGNSGAGLANASGTVPDISSTQSKFGGFALAYASSGNSYVLSSDVDYQMGTGDATVEFWVRPANVSTQYILFDNRVGGSGGFNIASSTTSGVIEMRFGGGAVITSAGSTLVANTWQHIAWSRASGTSRLFVDGTQVGSDYSDSNSYNQSQIVLGAAYNGGLPAVSYYFDDWRVTVGVARYTSNFTAPTAAFPDS